MSCNPENRESSLEERITEMALDIANGRTKLRKIRVNGRTSEELLKDILGSAYRPKAANRNGSDVGI